MKASGESLRRFPADSRFFPRKNSIQKPFALNSLMYNRVPPRSPWHTTTAAGNRWPTQSILSFRHVRYDFSSEFQHYRRRNSGPRPGYVPMHVYTILRLTLRLKKHEQPSQQYTP